MKNLKNLVALHFFIFFKKNNKSPDAIKDPAEQVPPSKVFM